MSFRKNLEYLRKKKNLSQEDLAYKLGVSRQAVSKWESGAAYPETEKMITMCTILDCTLDELIKEDIPELRSEEARKYTFNDLVKEVTDLIKRTSDMLTSMNGKMLFKFLFELAVLFVLILLLRVPFKYVGSLGYNVFFAVGGSVGEVLTALWRFIIEMIYFITAVVSFLYVYKIRFLDKSEYIVNNQKNQEIEEESVKKENRKVETVKYDFGVFSLLGKAVVLFIKFCSSFFSLFIIALMLFAVAGLVVVLSWIFEGVFFFSIILFALSFLLFSLLILYVIYNFIVNRRSKWDKLFMFLLISFMGFGVSMGVGVLEMKEFTFTNNVREYMVEDKKTESVDMKDSLIIGEIWYPNITYIEDSSMGSSVKVEVSYYGDFRKIEIEGADTDRITIQSSRVDVPLSRVYELLIRDLKDRTVHVEYGYLLDYDITVIASKENIEKIESNVQKEKELYLYQQTEVVE